MCKSILWALLFVFLGGIGMSFARILTHRFSSLSLNKGVNAMKMERTLSIIKPDGVRRNLLGAIISRFEQEKLAVVALKRKRLNPQEAEGFYAVHKDRPFFAELVIYMCSGPLVLMVLEGENAIQKNRDIMGATNPAQAQEGTIRKLYALSIGENTVHGSDSEQTARAEIAWFFAQSEIGF